MSATIPQHSRTKLLVRFVHKGRRFAFVSLFLSPAIGIGLAALVLSSTAATSSWNPRGWPANIGQEAGEALLGGFLVCALLVITWNTITYSVDAWSKRSAATMVLIPVTVLVVLAWASDVVTGWLRTRFGTEGRHHLNDGFALVIFLLFFLMDGILWRKSRADRIAAGRSAASPSADEDLYQQQSLFLDLPAIIGIVVVNTVMHYFLEHSHAMGTTPSSRGLLMGVPVGALLMQLVMSQIVFIAIYANYLRREYTEFERSEVAGNGHGLQSKGATEH